MTQSHKGAGPRAPDGLENRASGASRYRMRRPRGARPPPPPPACGRSLDRAVRLRASWTTRAGVGPVPLSSSGTSFAGRSSWPRAMGSACKPTATPAARSAGRHDGRGVVDLREILRRHVAACIRAPPNVQSTAQAGKIGAIPCVTTRLAEVALCLGIRGVPLVGLGRVAKRSRAAAPCACRCCFPPRPIVRYAGL